MSATTDLPPVIALDIGGVLASTWPPVGGARYTVHAYTGPALDGVPAAFNVWLNREHGVWLRDLAAVTGGELVWALTPQETGPESAGKGPRTRVSWVAAAPWVAAVLGLAPVKTLDYAGVYQRKGISRDPYTGRLSFTRDSAPFELPKRDLIAAYARGRPIIWIDTRHGTPDKRWAKLRNVNAFIGNREVEERHGRTLLLTVSSQKGLTFRQFRNALTRWERPLTDADMASPTGHP